MHRLRSWISKVKVGEDVPPAPSLTVPSDRPSRQWTPDPQLQSPFFRLPPELRRKILRRAFGNCTIHMDFSFRPPADKANYPGHHPGHPPLVEFHLPPQPRWPRGICAWRWFSCVCHFEPPPDQIISPAPMWADQCLRGAGRCCEMWPGTAIEKCRLGVMGLLLSCKKG